MAFSFCPFMDPCLLVNTHSCVRLKPVSALCGVTVMSSSFLSFFFFCLRSTTADLSATTSKNKKVCRGHKHCCNLSHHQWHKVSKDCRSSGLTVSLTPFGKHIVMLFLSTFRYIVDSGFVKQLNHNSRVGMDILEVVPISK